MPQTPTPWHVGIAGPEARVFPGPGPAFTVYSHRANLIGVFSADDLATGIRLAIEDAQKLQQELKRQREAARLPPVDIDFEL